MPNKALVRSGNALDAYSEPLGKIADNRFVEIL